MFSPKKNFSTVFALALAVCFHLSVQARAEPILSFSSHEQSIIQRNEILRSLIDSDPNLVHQILDALPHSNSNPIVSIQPKSEGVEFEHQPVDAKLGSLMERAKSEVATLNASRKLRTRSPEGSVEYIEMMRRAKAAKEQQTKPSEGR